MSSIITQLEQAKSLAFSNKSTFPQVLSQVLKLSTNQDIEVQKWCAKFFKDSFTSSNDVLGITDKIDLAIDALDSLLFLLDVKNLEIFKDSIETAIVVYKLVFKYVVENDGCKDVWVKLNQIIQNLLSKYKSSFPLDHIDEESDLRRAIDCKIELMKFIVLVIDFGSPNQPQSNNSGNGKKKLVIRNQFNLEDVPSNHTLIIPSILEKQSYNHLDVILSVFNQDILVTPLITASLSHLAVIVSKKSSHFILKILNTLESYDTQRKNQSNYETVEEFKLSRKYVDRSLKVFFSYVLRNQLAPTPQMLQWINKKLNLLISRGDEIRKKNILAPSLQDSNIKKRKFEGGFVNVLKKLKTADYKNLYSLQDPNNELNNFDLTTLPQHILISMTLNALNKVSVERLTKALNIIVDRYKNTLNDPKFQRQAAKKGGDNWVKSEYADENDEDDEDDDEDDDADREGNNEDDYSETVFTLPPPKELSFEDKKSHVNIIIKNFFKLSEKPVNDGGANLDPITESDKTGVDSELTRIAIKSWKKDSWLILLTRLATRGMRGVDGDEEGSDFKQNENISNIIRKALFDHFLDNIHSRIDLIIEWLSEEWYSEKVFNEDKLIEELREKYSNDEAKVQQELSQATIPTPLYNDWTGKVLDAMIPFLEPNDRKIFIRLLSDLPYLNGELVDRIKSLCFDPVRSKIGFLSLQFLIMYRPPVKDACIGILEELSKSDQEDLREESEKLLKKYKPEAAA